MNQATKLGLKLLASLVLIALLARLVDLPKLGATLVGVDLGLVGAAAALFLGGQAINALKWLWIGRALALTAGGWTYLRLYGMGLFLSIFLPGSTGGDLGRAVLLARSGQPGWAATYSVLADRYSGMLFLLVLSSLAAVGIAAYRDIAPWLWGLTVVVAAVWLLLGWASRQFGRFAGKWGRYLGPVAAWEADLRARPNLVRIGASSLLIQMVNWLVLVVLAAALHLQVGAGALLVAYGLITLASLAPLSLNGLGIREGGYVLLLGAVGVPAEQAVSFGILWFFVFLVTGLVSGVASWLDPAKQPLKAG